MGEAVELPHGKLRLISSSRKTGLGFGFAVNSQGIYHALVEPQRVLLL